MRSEKRWMDWVLNEAMEMRIKMPWEYDKRPAAFANLDIETAEIKAT
jgi:hypothetical protein